MKNFKEFIKRDYFTWFFENEDHAQALRDTGFWGKQGAGCIILAKDTKRILLPLRSSHVEQPLTWGTWGGAIDSDENPEQAAKREVQEEAGYTGFVETTPLSVFQKGSFKYFNFLAIVDTEFKPHLNWESKSYDWFTFGQWPKPLHFGLAWLLERDGDKILSFISRLN